MTRMNEQSAALTIDATGPHEVAEDTYYQQVFSSVTAFETDEGIVLVDTGDAEYGPQLAEMLRSKTAAPIHTVVYTHGHVDHVHGLEPFLREDQEDPRIVAHEAMPDRWERYERTREHNHAINARQFGGTVEATGDRYDEEPFRTPDYPPTEIFRKNLTLEVGDLTFELHHGRGETDDHTWLYCPERDVLCTGDFYISLAPNAGNPQKVQRYPEEWATALREMAALEPGTLCGGHGGFLQDPDTIQERLHTSADYLETIVERTLDALNDESPPHVDIVHAVDLPDAEEPWLRELYDEGEFIVRNVIRRYGGWWTGRPSELKPAPREATATDVADLAGGAEAVAERAQSLAEDGAVRRAAGLADFALEAAPENEAVQERVAAVYRTRAEHANSLMARNIYNSAAAYADDGRPYR